MPYLALKLVHLIGVVLFLGNITVGVFWKRFADRTNDLGFVARTMDAIVASDRVFTIPGIVILLIGGFGAAQIRGYPILGTGWILWALVAFVLAGVAFGPLSRAQRAMAAAAHGGDRAAYERLSKSWNAWGAIALLLPVVAFVLMILKPELPAFHR